MNPASSPLRLLLLGADPSRDPVCLSVDSSGQIRARRVCDAADPLPAEPGARDILVVPADALRLHPGQRVFAQIKGVAVLD